MAARIILRLRRQAALTPRQPPAILQKLDSRDLAIVLLGVTGSAAVMVWAVAGAIATIVSSFFIGLFYFLGQAVLAVAVFAVLRLFQAEMRRAAREDREFEAKMGGLK